MHQAHAALAKRGQPAVIAQGRQLDSDIEQRMQQCSAGYDDRSTINADLHPTNIMTAQPGRRYGLGQRRPGTQGVLAFPGVEFLYPVIFASVVRDAGRGVLGGLRRVGLRPSAYVEQIWRSYESLTEPEARGAFARTLRSVVDASGQRVSAHDRLPLARDIPTLIVWGSDDAIIPCTHAADAAATLPTAAWRSSRGLGTSRTARTPIVSSGC